MKEANIGAANLDSLKAEVTSLRILIEKQTAKLDDLSLWVKRMSRKDRGVNALA